MITNDITNITSAIGQTGCWRNICQIMAGSRFRFSCTYYVLLVCIRLLLHVRLWKSNTPYFCIAIHLIILKGLHFLLFCVNLPRYLNLKMADFCDVTSCSPVEIFRSFWLSCCFYCQGGRKLTQRVSQKSSKSHEVTFKKTFIFIVLAWRTSHVLISLNTSHYCY